MTLDGRLLALRRIQTLEFRPSSVNRPESGLKVGLILWYIPIDLCLELSMETSTAHEGNQYV